MKPTAGFKRFTREGLRFLPTRRTVMMRRLWFVGVLVVGLTTVAWGVRAATDDAAARRKPVASAKDESDAKVQHRPEWLRVEVQKGGKDHQEKTVSIRLPLAVLRLLGKEASVDLTQFGVHTSNEVPKKVPVADLLDALESGSTIVEVNEADSHVKVWVE
jgi:hypothetical protein